MMDIKQASYLTSGTANWQQGIGILVEDKRKVTPICSAYCKWDSYNSMSNYIEEYNVLLQSVATEYSKRYKMLERNDIAQELWMWFLTHVDKYVEWSELEQKDKDKLIARSLRNAAITYCEYEKSKKVGYDMSDLYYYNPSVVEAFLPSIISESYEIPTKYKTLTLSLVNQVR